MANKTFSDFTNQPTPLGSDYVVGYRGTTEQRYTLSVISGLIAAAELASPLTTVGDIWGYDGTDARIPVGSDGEVLVADSTESLGVKWGATGTSSSPWTQAGSDVYYTGNVAIGVPGVPAGRGPLWVQDTTERQTLATFSGNNDNYIGIMVEGRTGSNGIPSRVRLAAGYDLGLPTAQENRGGGLLATDRMTFHVDADIIAQMTGQTVVAGKYSHSTSRLGPYIDSYDPRILVLPNRTSSDARIDLLSTGTHSFNLPTNLINFTAGSSDDAARHCWTLGQDIDTSASLNTSDFIIAYHTGHSDTNLTGDAVVTFTDTKHILPGTSGTQNLGAADTSWATAYLDKLYVSGVRITGNGGGGGDSSPLTTKGDLYGFTTENARIGTGVNGQVLTVDSTEAAGVAWADSAAGCPVTSWTEAFEEDADGNLTPVTSNCVNDTMWMLNSDYSLSLRANYFRYNTNHSYNYTEDVSF